MSLTSAELQAYFEETEGVLNRAQSLAAVAVRFAAGRLRRMNLSSWLLKELKRELTHYNAHTKRWED